MSVSNTPFIFAIPLKPKAISQNWNLVQENLFATLRSIFNSTNPNFLILIASHDKVDHPLLEDERVIFLDTPFNHVSEIVRGIQDKQAKLRLIGAWLKEHQFDDTYVMFLDADDLVHRILVDYALKDNNEHGYIIKNGYRFDHSTGSLARQFGDFDKSCGSCFIGFFKNEDFPVSYQDKSSYFGRFGRHTVCVEEATNFGRPPSVLPFPAAVYMTNHDESLRRARLGGRTRDLKHRYVMTPSESMAILQKDFAFALLSQAS